MAKTYPMQASFAVGVITGRSIARLDTEMHNQAVAVLDNMLPTSQGPAIRRGGMETVADFVHAGKPIKLFEFEVNAFHTYSVIISGGSQAAYRTCNIANPTGTIYDVSADLCGADRAFSDGSGSTWQTFITALSTGAVDFQTGACTIRCGDTAGDIAFLSGGFSGLTPGYRYLVNVVFDEEFEEVPVDILYGSTAGDDDLGSKLGYKGLAFYDSLGITVPAGGEIYITFQVDDPEIVKRVTYVSLVYASLAWNNAVKFTSPSGWATFDAIETLQAEIAPGTYDMYFASLYEDPQKLNYNPATEAWTFSQPGFTNNPWSAGDYPGTITFFESRSFWGGSNDNPETIWASKTNAVEDMTTGSLAADALLLTINKKGKIRWMIGAKNLVVGTSKGEHIITSESGLTPSDAQIDQQSTNGSTRIQAIQVGNQIVYVSHDARKIRAMKYEWTEDGWATKDLSYFTLNLTEARIKGIAFSQNPDNIITCALSDGNAISCVFDQENELYGWSTFDADVDVLSVMNYEMRGGSHLMILTDTGVELIRRKYYVDHVVRRVGIALLSQMSYHTEYIGEDVALVVDGEYVGDVEVEAGGNVPFPDGVTGYDSHAGLPYISKLVTLPLSGAKASGGLGIAGSKRTSKLWARVIAKELPTINGKIPNERFLDDPMVLTGESYARDIAIQDLGFSQYAQIEISTDGPFKMDVCGIFSEASQDVME